MTINKIEEAKKLVKKGLYNEAGSLMDGIITKTDHMIRDYRDLWGMYGAMAGAVEKAIKIHNNQINYIGFYDDRLEAVGTTEVEALKKILINLQNKEKCYETLHEMCNELIGIYIEATGE